VDTPKGQPGRRSRSLTLDQAVALLTTAANGRVPAPAHPGVRPGAPCPQLPGGGIRVTFLARAGGLPLAVAQGPAACGTVQFSAGGKRQPALQITGSFILQVFKLAGLRWKVR
jgi:hypothetical protein